MLTLYRRHLSSCPHFKVKKRGTPAEEKNSCECPIWVQGTIGHEAKRRALDTTAWGRAEKEKRKLEDGTPLKAPVQISIKHALDAYIKDAESRNLSQGTLKKYRRLQARLTEHVEQRLRESCGTTGIASLDSERVRVFRSSWKLSPVTATKEIGFLRAFFTFCLSQDWISKNPAKTIKPPQTKLIPRIPFSEKEIQNILSQAQDDRELAFLLTMRHTGLRIGDVSLLRTTALTGDRIYLYTTKSGAAVSILIPDNLLTLLKKLPPSGGYFFLRGESTHPHTASDLWRKRIKAICKTLKIVPDHPHRFRHSLAAELLNKGASVEQVAAILGNSPAIVAKHYSQWIKSRQDNLDAFLQKTWQTKLVLVK